MLCLNAINITTMVLSTNRYNFLYASNEIIFLLSLVALQLEVLVIASLLLLPYLEMEKQLSCSMDVQRFSIVYSSNDLVILFHG